MVASNDRDRLTWSELKQDMIVFKCVYCITSELLRNEVLLVYNCIAGEGLMTDLKRKVVHPFSV